MCFLHVSRTIWVQLSEMSDSLLSHNAKRKTLMTSFFKHSFSLFVLLVNWNITVSLWIDQTFHMFP